MYSFIPLYLMKTLFSMDAVSLILTVKKELLPLSQITIGIDFLEILFVSNYYLN
jgi:hypothetical protein